MASTLWSALPTRYQACAVLQQQKIAHVVWFEDVLVYYGSDTCVFDLILLVDKKNLGTAVKALIAAGYHETDLRSKYKNDSQFCRGGTRLENTDGDGALVLVDAHDWFYDLTDASVPVTIPPMPPLHRFIESEECMEKPGWAMYLVGQINYAYYLPEDSSNRKKVRHEDFAANLARELHETHYDMIGSYPGKVSIDCYQKHRYHALRSQQIKVGMFEPRPCPTDNIPPSLNEYAEWNGLSSVQSVPAPKRRRMHPLMEQIVE
ncbi:hypothetical protein QBC43DRAFT_304148 [Cladorrhinum sp. PSN259]|nr:hypothetical protein QBC43DRAFT_304148 [Cladorrhinum sp. PSN259]